MWRWLMRIMICLILGAITTIAVAWGCAWHGESNRGCYPQNERPLSSAEVSIIRQHAPDGFTAPSETMRCFLGFGYRRYLDTLRPRDAPFPPDALSIDRDVFDILLAGWPFKCLFAARFQQVRGDSFRAHSSESIVVGNLKEFAAFIGGGGTMIPAHPIWPGFIIDTLICSAIWFGLCFGFGAARRTLRRKRGLCPRCGYDLRGGRAGSPASPPGCPECGWNREKEDSDTGRS